MTKAKIKPARILTNFLRSNISDVNGSRSGYWIFDDYPLVKNLGDNQFPRISITTLTESSVPMGLYDDTQFATVTFSIEVWAKKDQKFTVTVTDESMGDVSSSINNDRLTFNDVPSSVTNIKHNTVAYGTVTAKNTDVDFTTPASMSGDVIEWSKSTGNLNLNATDVTGDDGEAITSTYTLVLSNLWLCTYLARKVMYSIRNNWRTDTTLHGLFYPRLISSNPLPIDEDLGVFRYIMEYQFNVINPHEGV